MSDKYISTIDYPVRSLVNVKEHAIDDERGYVFGDKEPLDIKVLLRNLEDLAHWAAKA